MDLNSVIASVKSLAVIRQGGLRLSDLNREYREMIGENLNPRQYGFNTLEALLTSVPEIRIKPSMSGPMLVVNDKKISHVADLVSRQSTKKKKSKKPKYKSGGYMQRSNNQYGRPQFNSGYRRPDVSQCHSRPQPAQKYGSSMNNGSYRPQTQWQARPPSGPPTQSRSQPKPLSRPPSQTKYHQDSCDSWSSASDDTWDCPSHKPTSTQSSSRQVFAPKPSNSTQPNKTTSYNDVRSTAEKPKLQSSISKPQNSYNSSSVKPAYHFDKTCSFGAGDVRLKMKENASSAQSHASMNGNNPSQVESKSAKTARPVKAEGTSCPAQLKSSDRIVPSSNLHCEGSSEKFASGRGRGQSVLECFVNIAPVGKANDDGVVVVGPGSNNSRVSQLTDFGISVTIDNCSTEAASDWDTEFEPSICEYQLIGDDMLLRLTEVSLDYKVYVQGGVKQCGMCIANQTIEECHKRVKEGEPMSDAVIVMLGLTDVLHGHTLSEMKASMGALLGTLRKKASSIILLTLPVLPSLIGYPKAHRTLLDYNSWLLSMKNTVFNLVIEDIVPWLSNHSEEVMFERVLGETDTWTEDGCWTVMEGICSKML